MDGNPNVGADTLRAGLARQRELVLERYAREAGELSRRLSQSGALTGVSDGVRERVATYGAQFPKALAAIPTRYHDMPYRVLFALMAARLEATRRDDTAGYISAAELERDLGVVGASLRAHRGEHAGTVRRAAVAASRRDVRLSPGTIDVRQHSHVHRAVVGTLLGDPTWPARPAAERLARLRLVLERGEAPSGSPDAEAARTLEVFKAIADCRARYGPDAVGPYIISMAQGADDVLSVLALARWGGLGARRHEPLDVAPLFETVTDLEGSPAVMRELLEEPYYRAHLAERGNAPDGDDRITPTATRTRGSARRAGPCIGRRRRSSRRRSGRAGGAGGSTSHSFTAGRHRQPRRRQDLERDSERAGRLDSRPPPHDRTGEAINAKYGLRGIALRTLEQTVSAVALATALPRPVDAREPTWTGIMDAIGQDSRARIARSSSTTRSSWNTPAATPIDVIQRMEIGSRPATRSPTTNRRNRSIARHPLGVRLDAEPPPATGLVWPGDRTGPRAERYGVAALDDMIPRVAVPAGADRRRRDGARHGGFRDRGTICESRRRAWRPLLPADSGGVRSHGRQRPGVEA